MSPCKKVVCALVMLLLCCRRAEAHKPSDSFVAITGGASELQIQWDIALKDLELLVGLDTNQNGEITWGEVKQQRDAIVALALSRLQIATDGNECRLEVSDLLVTRHSDGAYAALVLATNAPGDAKTLTVEYHLLFEVDPTHRGLVLYQNGNVASTYVLSPDTPRIEIIAENIGHWRAFTEYVREGVWHIWIGFDHILFLISLLLPAVLFRQDGKWWGVEKFRPACAAVLKVVTMFTLAHSITLWLAVMEYVRLPSQLVESAIAFSIVITAINNMYPILPLSNWSMAFGFGLIHGFGFANVLLDLGLTNVTLALSLFGFNVGVELGQVAIVLLVLPLAYALRQSFFYQQLILRAGSGVIAAVALIWMYERLMNVTVFQL